MHLCSSKWLLKCKKKRNLYPSWFQSEAEKKKKQFQLCPTDVIFFFPSPPRSDVIWNTSVQCLSVSLSLIQTAMKWLMQVCSISTDTQRHQRPPFRFRTRHICGVCDTTQTLPQTTRVLVGSAAFFNYFQMMKTNERKCNACSGPQYVCLIHVDE